MKENKYYYIGFFICLFTCLYHGSAFSAPAVADIFYQNPEDMSIKYLSMIFGNVGNALQGYSSDVLVNIFRIFNIMILSFGTITVVYTVIVSTINTAQEGEAMGKKWSSMWLPLRSVGGLALLLPTQSGYSLIQIMIMSIIIKGVNAGNAVFYTILDRVGEGEGLVVPKQTVKTSLLTKSVKPVLNIASCMEYLNNHPDLIDGNTVELYEKFSQGHIGVPGHIKYKNICGTISISENPALIDMDNVADGLKGNITPDEWRRVQRESAIAALDEAKSYALEVIREKEYWANKNDVQIKISKAIEAPLVGVTIKDTSKQAGTTTLQNVLIEARKAGWIFAAVNYFKLLNPNNLKDYKPTPPNFTFNKDQLNNLGLTEHGKLGSYIQNQTFDYIAGTPNLEGTTGTMLSQANAANPEEQKNKMVDSAGLGDAFEQVRKSLSEGEGDPISSMRQVGIEIMASIEIAFWLLVGITLIGSVIACIASGIQPACSVFFTIIQTLIPILLFFMALLWSVGVLLGLYVPMIPYMVFTFSAMAWLIMVIEAIVAAPIVALGLVSPSAENLGKASPAILLITNIFMRPSLMIIGLVIAAKLLSVAIKMLNFGFNYFMLSFSPGTYGLFGGIAVLIIYGGIVINLTEECFTLIHVLPDKVNRWIGGQAEQSGAGKHLGEMQKSFEKGGQTSMQLMEGVGKGLAESKKAALDTQNIKHGKQSGGGATKTGSNKLDTRN